ncbi:MAG: hypothetical protein J6Y03_03465 [Alphaproteobacteria bacterium]|nr:hypothetical protein [Alphaproteobacteria bacterium]
MTDTVNEIFEIFPKKIKKEFKNARKIIKETPKDLKENWQEYLNVLMFFSAFYGLTVGCCYGVTYFLRKMKDKCAEKTECYKKFNIEKFKFVEKEFPIALAVIGKMNQKVWE